MYPDTTISQLQLVHPVVDFFESTYLVVQWHIVFEKKNQKLLLLREALAFVLSPFSFPLPLSLSFLPSAQHPLFATSTLPPSPAPFL